MATFHGRPEALGKPSRQSSPRVVADRITVRGPVPSRTPPKPEAGEGHAHAVRRARSAPYKVGWVVRAGWVLRGKSGYPTSRGMTSCARPGERGVALRRGLAYPAAGRPAGRKRRFAPPSVGVRRPTTASAPPVGCTSLPMTHEDVRFQSSGEEGSPCLDDGKCTSSLVIGASGRARAGEGGRRPYWTGPGGRLARPRGPTGWLRRTKGCTGKARATAQYRRRAAD